METAILVLIPILMAGCTIATFFIARSKDRHENGRQDGVIQTDIEYVKRRIDDVLLESRDINKRLDVYAERLTRVEESSKQAHKRLDEITSNKE
jgi:septal ring factor EnvC (AmiA/AmiB activator)